jgi:hypothetical protein
MPNEEFISQNFPFVLAGLRAVSDNDNPYDFSLAATAGNLEHGGTAG